MRAVRAGEEVCVQVEPHEGRELKFALKPEGRGGTPPRRLRPHAGWFDAQPPAESAHAPPGVHADTHAQRVGRGVVARCNRDAGFLQSG